MSVDNKRKLSIVVYYTLAILTIVASIFFGYALIVRNLALWAKIVYFIWIAGVVGVVIFDIICTSNKEGKTLTGVIIYVLSLLAIAMAVILYLMNTTRAGLAVEFFNMFISVSLLSLVATGFLIATWCVGESLVEHKTAIREMKAKKEIE